MAIIKSRHIKRYETFFRFYTRRKLKKHFNQIIVENDSQTSERALLLIGNHFSWWDGFIAYYLNFTFFRKRFHVMMLEEQLENRMFLNKVGAFSIKKSDRSLIESLAYSSEILSDRQNMLLMFPQGRFETIYTRNFIFEPGIEKILIKTAGEPDIWFMANQVDYFSREKPTLFIRTKKHTGDFSTGSLQEAYNRFFDECVAKQSEDLV